MRIILRPRYQVNWIDKDKRSLNKRDSTITLQIDNKNATINNEQVELDVPAMIIEEEPCPRTE